MTDPTLRVATWNILGRRNALTCEPADSGAVCSVVLKNQPDVLCLQEVHFYDGQVDDQLLDELRAAGLRHFRWLPLSPSHLDSSALLGLGIASALPLCGDFSFRLTNPGLRISKNGQEWVLHDKGVMGCTVALPSGPDIEVHCLHLFPFHEFRVASGDRCVSQMWQEFWSYADNLARRRNVILAGDFNQLERRDAARQWSSKGWEFCFSNQVTTSRGLSLDDVVLSESSWETSADLMPTFSDHFIGAVSVRPK